MKFCKYCGKELADEAVLCTGCGCATDDLNSKTPSGAERPGEMSLMALLGFIFSFISCIVGLILSCLAYKTAVRENDEKSKTFSKAGIIISSVAIGIMVISWIVVGFSYGALLLSMFAGIAVV